MDEVLKRFAEQTPVAVMAQAALRRIFADTALDELFERHAKLQYTKELSFSTLVKLLSQVTLGTHKDVHASYCNMSDISVSVVAVYAKLQRIELGVSQALVKETARSCEEIIAALPLPRPDAIRGLKLKTLDGNFLAGTDHRLKSLRRSGAAALPGMSLVVREGRTGLLTNVIPCEDAYTNERTLAGRVGELVEANDLWMADRNFCTRDYFEEIAQRQAYFLIRHHAGTRLESVGKERFVGTNATGDVHEEKVSVSGKEFTCRCITVKLHEPLRDGSTEIRLLTNVPASKAGATRLADLYRTRWQIETAFQELTVSLRCEINTLGYPKAALFAFCLAIAAYNVLVVIRAALASGQGQRKVEEELSSYRLATEMATVAPGLAIAVPAECWQPFIAMTSEEFARWLQRASEDIDWTRYRKAKRGPKKPVTIKRTNRGAHRSTARVLKQARQTP